MTNIRTCLSKRAEDWLVSSATVMMDSDGVQQRLRVRKKISRALVINQRISPLSAFWILAQLNTAHPQGLRGLKLKLKLQASSLRLAGIMSSHDCPPNTVATLIPAPKNEFDWLDSDVEHQYPSLSSVRPDCMRFSAVLGLCCRLRTGSFLSSSFLWRELEI